MKHANGEFVWFVDSDDFIARQSLEWADEELKRNPELKAIRYYRRNVAENTDAKEVTSTIYSPQIPQTPTAISYFVKRQHLIDNNITFNQKMAYGEDTLWVFEVNFLAGEECVVDGGKVNYFYRLRQGSAMRTHSIESKRKHLESMEIMLEAYERILNERGDKLTAAQRQHLGKRVDWSVQNVLFDSLRVLSKSERNELFQRVAPKQKSMNFGKLSTKYGVNNLLVNIIGLPLKYKHYYTFAGWILSIIRK